MKKKQMVHVVGLLLGMTFVSCSQSPESELTQNGQGKLTLILDANTDFISTRAVNEDSYKNVSEYNVLLLDESGNVKLECKGSELSTNTPMTLNNGTYFLKAFYGKEENYSREGFYVYGEKAVHIVAEENISETLTCTPTCGKISVNFDQEMANYFSDYSVSFKGTKAMGADSIQWLKADADPWYVKLEPNGETVTYTIQATAKEEYVGEDGKSTLVTTSTFNLARNKAFKLNVKPTYTPTGDGVLDITITIDDTTNDKEVEVEVPSTWL